MKALLAGAAAAAVVAAAFGAPTPPSAAAEPCPDIAVAFARATGEFPGVGGVGQAFVDALRMQAGGRTVGAHGVIYPASNDFGGGPAFTQNVVEGVRDEANHVQAVLSACPDTKMVLGGYSQGAMVTAFVTSDGMPAEMPAADSVAVPLPAEIADRVAAVVLFGKPTGGALVKYGVPAADVGPRFGGKTLELCAPGDMVCSGDPAGWNSMAHMSYTGNGMVAQGAAFALSRL